MSNYSRFIQDDNSQGGAKQLYVFPYIEISESNITIADNYLTSFPFSSIYDLNASDITFEEIVSEFYEQKVSFKLKKLLAVDQLKDLAKKDFRIIIKDNNGKLRLLGLYTGLEGKFSKSIGTSRSDFNGYNFNFETKEEQTAPFISTSAFSSFFYNAQSFQFQVTTTNSGTSTNTQFKLPLTSVFTDNITVYWGDDTRSNITSYNQSEVTHTYASAGTYNIIISGAITAGWSFNNGEDCKKMGNITKFGGFSSTTAGAFRGCSNLTSIGSDVNFLNQATSLTFYFTDCGLTSLPYTLTLASLTNGTYMFAYNNITSLPSTLTLANLTDGEYMFGSNSLVSLASSMTLASLTNGVGMFEDNQITDLPSGITLSSLSNGTNIFNGNTINTTRYSQLLTDLENLNTNNSFNFHGGNSEYNISGQTARNTLTSSPRNLTITDGGLYAFQFQVTTTNSGTSTNTQFKLPLTSVFTDNITVDWGDGTSSNITSYNQSEVTHTYASAGTYNIATDSITAGWSFNYGGDRLKMGDITMWGGFSSTTAGAFRGCSNLTSIGSDVDFLNQATNLSSYFYDNRITSLPSAMTLASLTDGDSMFFNNSLTSLPSGMTLSSLTSGSAMFHYNSLTSLPSAMLLTSLTDGDIMFANNSLTSLPYTLTLASLTNGKHMFENNSLTALPSAMTLGNVTAGGRMFLDNSLTALPSAMTLASLTDGDSMFFNNSLTSLPSGMTLASLTEGRDIFRSNSLTALPSAMTLASLTNGNSMFYNNSLTALPSGMTLANVTDGNYMFLDNSLTSLPSGMTLASLTSGYYMFSGNSLTSLPSAMTLGNVTSGNYMFKDNSLTSLPSGMTLASLTSGYFMFDGNTINTTRYSQLLIDLENLNTNNSFNFHGGNSQYNTSGQTARNILTSSPRNLTIIDGGLV